MNWLSFALGIYVTMLIISIVVTLEYPVKRNATQWIVDMISCLIWFITIPIGLILRIKNKNL